MINQLRRDVRAKHYKPLLLLITLDFLDEQKSFAPIIPAKKIVDEFEIIMRKIGYKKEHNKGWMPFWHLSGDDIWNLYSINHQIVKRTAFKQFKPKTKKQLLSKVNYALINLDKINYFSSTNKRAATRKQIFNLLKKDQDLIGNKILEYYNV